MPTYEYECEKCGHQFERFQNMTDKPLKRCPECRCKVRRLLGAGAGIIFKGSGFYETDYRSAGYTEAAKQEKSESSSKGDDKKGDSGKKTSDGDKSTGTSGKTSSPGKKKSTGTGTK